MVVYICSPLSFFALITILKAGIPGRPAHEATTRWWSLLSRLPSEQKLSSLLLSYANCTRLWRKEAATALQYHWVTKMPPVCWGQRGKRWKTFLDQMRAASWGHHKGHHKRCRGNWSSHSQDEVWWITCKPEQRLSSAKFLLQHLEMTV